MTNPNSDRILAAIMFADIVSYSRLMGTNEEEALRLLNDFENISIIRHNSVKRIKYIISIIYYYISIIYYYIYILYNYII